jgi:hypothetical protein
VWCGTKFILNTRVALEKLCGVVPSLFGTLGLIWRICVVAGGVPRLFEILGLFWIF